MFNILNKASTARSAIIMFTVGTLMQSSLAEQAQMTIEEILETCKAFHSHLTGAQLDQQLAACIMKKMAPLEKEYSNNLISLALVAIVFPVIMTIAACNIRRIMHFLGMDQFVNHVTSFINGG